MTCFGLNNENCSFDVSKDSCISCILCSKCVNHLCNWRSVKKNAHFVSVLHFHNVLNVSRDVMKWL